MQKPFTLFEKEAAILNKPHNQEELSRLRTTIASFRSTNTLSEIEGIKKQIQTPFQKARAIILEAVFDIAILDCYEYKNYDEYKEHAEEEFSILYAKIKKAAQDLIKAESNDSLHYPLIWLFIPQEYHRILSMELNEIGYWQSAKDKPAPRFSEPRQKIGRNAPCPCGSGKKYKKCCGAQ